MRKVIHHITLNYIGGMQSSYISYYNYAKKKSNFKILTFGNYKLENFFYKIDNYSHLGFNIFNWVRFISYLRSDKVIKVFHGSLGSKKLNLLFKIFKPNNIFFYEHGNAWNLDKLSIPIVKQHANLSQVIIANSKATKFLLEKKFNIQKNKIIIVNYGYEIKKKYKKFNNEKFTVGFLGRFDAHKGAHIFLEAAKFLEKQNFVFKIAGDGQFKEHYLSKYCNSSNIIFYNRITNPLKFINSLDCLIIPSIREPLGLVAVEAGIVNTPVIASCVDGLPEVIAHNCGILIKPSIPLNKFYFHKSIVPLPKKVVDLKNARLINAKELDYKLLAKHIVFYSKNNKTLKIHRNRLREHVVKIFSIDKMFLNLEELYKKYS